MKKSQFIKALIVILSLIAISVGLFFAFKALGITDVEKLRNIIASCGAWGIVVFICLQILVVSLLCFVPATSMTFITLGVVLFGANWKAFLICMTGNFLASITMDALGRFGGSKVITKIVGEDNYNKALDLVQTKGMVYVPVMYLLPMFPDDAICFVCGSLKIKWWVHYLEILICRGIGCATIVFGVNILPQDLVSNITNISYIGSHLFDYLTMITVLTFWVLVLLAIARRLDKWLSAKLCRGKNRGKELNSIKLNKTKLGTKKKSCFQSVSKNTYLNQIEQDKQIPVAPTSKNKSPN